MVVFVMARRRRRFVPRGLVFKIVSTASVTSIFRIYSKTGHVAQAARGYVD